MKTECFKKTMTLLSKSLLTLTAFAFAAGCGGGGSGGASGPTVPEKSPYVTVSSVTPITGAVDVDGQISEIKVSLSENVDISSFVTEGNALSNMFETRAKKQDSDILGLKDSAGNILLASDIAKLTLEQLAAKNIQLVARYKDVAGALVQGPVEISGYQFVSEDETGLSSLLLFVKGVNEPFRFTGQEMIDSGYVNSNILKVEKINESGAVQSQALGQVSVSGREIKFRPINYIDWGSDFRITLVAEKAATEAQPAQAATATEPAKPAVPAMPAIKGIRDTSTPPRSLSDNFVSTFKTKKLPDVMITNTSPNGIGANPLKKITANTNLKIDAATLNSSTVQLNALVRNSNLADAQVTKYPTPFTVTFDPVQSQIVISPVNDLGYLVEYEVVISKGVKGALGAVAGQSLPVDYRWTFTTAEPKATSIAASSLVPVDAEGKSATVKIDFNFKLDPSSVKSGIKLYEVNSSGQILQDIDYSPTTSETSVELKPNSILGYGKSYKVTIDQNLRSKILVGADGVQQNYITLLTDDSYSFTNEVRKMVSYVPTSSGASELTEIVLSFNFNVSETYLTQAIVVTESVVGKSNSPADVSISVHPVNPRTVTIKSKKPEGFAFGSVINVNVSGALQAKGGGAIDSGSNFDVTIRTRDLTIVAKRPYSNGSSAVYFPLNSEIAVTFSYPLDTESIKSDAIRIQDCKNNTVYGRITYDSGTIYFLPSQTLKSFCKHTVTVSKDIKGKQNDTIPSNQAMTWDFYTDGLRVQNVYVTYAHGSSVDVSEPIEIVFNNDLDYVYSWDIELREGTSSYGSSVSGYVNRYGNKVTFDPYSNLKYGTTYTLYVSKDVKGKNGETLESDYSVSFTTQSLPIKVDNYGPIGTVKTNARFWAEFDRGVNTSGFPFIDGSLSPYTSVKPISNDNLYTFYIEPYSSLLNNQTYRVEFNWLENGQTRYHNWSVTTEKSVTGFSVGAEEEKSKKLSWVQNSSTQVTKEQFAESCKLDRNCVGSIYTKNNNDYRMLTLYGKRKADIDAKTQSARNLSR